MATHVVAMGGGGFSMTEGRSALDAYVLALAAAPEPVVCFVPTASGDSDQYVDRFHAAFADLPCTPVVLGLFERDGRSPAEVLAGVDVVYVGGGSTANLLALWRLHGVDGALAARAAAGPLVVAGVSAGALCWFEGGTTDSFGPLRALPDGLGWLAGSFSPHYDGEPGRRPTYHDAVARDVLGPGYAADDFAALHFVDGALHARIAERPGASTYRVERDGDAVRETALPTALLRATTDAGQARP